MSDIHEDFAPLPEEDDDDEVLPQAVNRRDARMRVMQALYAVEIGDRAGGIDVEVLAANVIYPDLKDRQDLLDFARDLLRRAHNNREECDALIQRLAENWDFNRIAPVDKAILRMGITELLYFTDIPTRVTINEAIEIAKIFSTDKSGIFINGMLDAAVAHLKEAGQMKKTGRGLVGD